MLLSGALLWAEESPGGAPAEQLAEHPETAIATQLESLSAHHDLSEFTFLEQQIYRGESADAQDSLETIVKQIEAARNRFDENLVVPLTLLGDTYMVQQDYPKALDTYDRARHTARVNYGLFDPRQLPMVYREANAYRKVGDLNSAAQREEYAFEVMHKSYGAYDDRLLPGLMRLGKFYLETENYLAARKRFTHALLIHTRRGDSASKQAIPALSGIAQTHVLERFPPYYIADPDDNVRRGPSAGLNISEIDRQNLTFNNFPQGEKALKQIIAIHQSQDPEDKQATLDAMTKLGDWYLLFGRNNTANTLYAHVYEQMAINGSNAQEYFAEPRLLHFPIPADPRPPPVSKRQEPATGYVTLQFDVAPSGRTRSMRTAQSEPPKLMDFRVRRSMRQSVFRPALVEGVAVTTKDQLYTHEYAYFPTAAQMVARTTVQPDAELTESEESKEPAVQPTQVTADQQIREAEETVQVEETLQVGEELQ